MAHSLVEALEEVNQEIERTLSMIKRTIGQLQLTMAENEGVVENVPLRSLKDYTTHSLGGIVSCI